MTYADFKKELLKRIDPSYSENSSYQSMAERAILDALRTVLISGNDNDFYGFKFKSTHTSATSFNLSTIKSLNRDLVKILKIENGTVNFIEKNSIDFYDRILKQVSSFDMYYTLEENKIVFKSSCTADIHYLAIPTISGTDDMIIYMNQSALEQLAQTALPMLDSVIRGSE